jgi:integrase/recombinase XerD
LVKGKTFIRNRRPENTEHDRRTAKVRKILHEHAFRLDEAFEYFAKAKLAEGLRERTINDYRKHIEYLKRYLATRGLANPFVTDLTTEIIRDYINYLMYEHHAYEGISSRKRQEKGLSVQTINMRIRSLYTMCSFWLKEGLIDDDPTKTIKQVKSDEQIEVPGIDDEVIRLILRSFDERQFAEFRDKTLILLMLDTGLRINEAVNLTVSQIDFKTGFITVPSEIAKNRKYRDVPVSREVLHRLSELHEDNIRHFREYERIFMNAYGDYFTADAFRKRMNRLKHRLGIDRLHPHMFRHTFARNYILNGGDIFTLQKILDHADISTTRKYVQMETTHLKAQHGRFSPIRKFIK